MKQYIKCDVCGKHIYFGEPIYTLPGYNTCTCSGECFASVYASKRILTEFEADNCFKKVFEEKMMWHSKETSFEIAKEIADLGMKEIDLCIYDRDMLEHDINNLRSNEWVESFEALPDNSKAKKLFFKFAVYMEKDNEY